ncbi:MAG: Na+/H+ antiporter NhaA, partial [Actinomycetes bacterium]
MKRAFSIMMTEAFSAYLLLPVALSAIVLGHNRSGSFLSVERHVLGVHLSLYQFVVEYLLAIFFYKIGLELRFELIHGVLKERKFLSISALSAGLGMIVPVVIFLLLTSMLHLSHQGWGVIMATDLPLVLALVAILKKGKLRPFILALATLDDIGSIIVLSFIQKSTAHWFYILIFVLVFIGYIQLSRSSHSATLLLVFFITGIILGDQAGIPVSLSAVLFGIFTIGQSSAIVSIENRLLRILEPVSAYLVIPLFLFVILFRKFDLTSQTFAGGLLLVMIGARLAGKPLGIFA